MTKHTDQELAAARAAYEAASPEERAEFDKYPNFSQPIALQFVEWRRWKQRCLANKARMEAKYANASCEDRAAFEANVALVFNRWLEQRKKDAREKFLKAHGWRDGDPHFDMFNFTQLSDHLWEQVSSLIAGRHIRPAPDPKSQDPPPQT